MRIFWMSETDVRTFIARSPDQIRNTPSERWGREVLNSMRRCPYDFIYLCDRYHLLPLFLNDLEQLKKIQIEGGKTLFEHTLDTLEVTQKFLMTRKRRESDMAFSMAMLFHHAGAVSRQPTNSAKAANIAAQYLRSWNINAETTDLVTTLINNYRLLHDDTTEEKLCAAVLKHGFTAAELLLDFAICNSQADSMKNMDVLVQNKWKLGEIFRRFEETKRRTNGSLRYLTGGEVMQTLDIKPGKIVGEILEELDMAVGMGIVNSKKEATDWLLRHESGSDGNKE